MATMVIITRTFRVESTGETPKLVSFEQRRYLAAGKRDIRVVCVVIGASSDAS